jgi:hypothetical protein
LFSHLGRPIKRIHIDSSKPAVILGNGPSLLPTLSTYLDFFKNKNCICVNDFAASDYFEKIKPGIYVFTDPAYWTRSTSERIRKQLELYRKKMIQNVDWDMTIIMPYAAKKWNYFNDLPQKNNKISICYINTTEINCNKRLRFFLYKKNLAIPPMQNVIVAALFVSINVGIRQSYLVGADHSWHESFFVGNDNILYLKNKRFQDKEEAHFSPFFQDPGESVPYRMDNLLFALAKMFQGYRELDEYSKKQGAKIYNASTKSYIDAFERLKLS